MIFLRDLSNGEAALLIASLVTFVNSIQSIRVSRIANRWQKFVEKACLGITLHRIPSLIQLMTMAIQSNFHFKATLDLFDRRAMQPRGTTMALFHNSWARLSSVQQALLKQSQAVKATKKWCESKPNQVL